MAISLNCLKSLNVPDNTKFTAILDFVKSFGSVGEDNKQVILTRIKDVPFAEILDRMLETEEWLNTTEPGDIGTCSRFLADIKAYQQENIIHLDQPNSTVLNGLSNNQQKKQTCQRFAKLEVPSTWFKVDDIKIWPLIVLKTRAFKRTRTQSIPSQMKQYVSKLLSDTTMDVGGVIEIEEGFSSIKIKCDHISSRSRLLRFLEPKLANWTLSVPDLRDPIVRINNIPINPDNLTELKDWLAKLKIRNEWRDSDDKIKICYAYKRNYGADVLVSVTPAIREKIERRFGMVNLGHTLTRATDYFDIKFCKRCVNYGHSTTKCLLISKCGFCGGNHTGSCEAEKDRKKQKCPNCLQYGTNAFDKTCPVYRIKLQHEMEKTNFNYQYIMN